MILGGEVDCVREGAGIKEGLETQDFIELKTNLVIESTRDEMNFERSVSGFESFLISANHCTLQI